MKKILAALLCAALLSGCVTPISYGDASGFIGMGFLAKKTVVIGYEGTAKPFEEIGVLALDARLRVRSIRNLNGETVHVTSKTIGGLGIINTPDDVQIHLSPGKYVLSTCFFVDMGNQGSFYCRTPLDVAVDIEANQMIQLSWASAKDGGWTVLQQPVRDDIRGRITQDFSKVMTPAKDAS